jgi:hypothetical protein
MRSSAAVIVTRLALLAFAAALVAPAVISMVHAQTSAAPLQGVWRVAEVTITGAGAASIKSPQPALYIFTRGHYSIVAINGAEPRKPVAALKDPAKPTLAEKAALYDHWLPVTGQSGTYRINGKTVTLRPVVAKNLGVMNGPDAVRDFTMEGTTMTLVTRSAAGQPSSETRTKLTRVE